MRAAFMMIVAGLALAPVAAPAATGMKNDKMIQYCVPLRDAQGQSTGANVCRTEAQWRRYVAAQAEKIAQPGRDDLSRRTATFYALQGWNSR